MIPAPKDGRDIDPDQVRAAIAEMVAQAVAEIPVPKDGRSVDPDEVRRMVENAVSQIPAPRDGKDVEPEVVRALVAEEVAAPSAAMREWVMIVPLRIA